MAIQRATDEANIRQRINRWVEALRTMDLEGVMSLYAPDIVSFDIVPPLRESIQQSSTLLATAKPARASSLAAHR